MANVVGESDFFNRNSSPWAHLRRKCGENSIENDGLMCFPLVPSEPFRSLGNGWSDNLATRWRHQSESGQRFNHRTYVRTGDLVGSVVKSHPAQKYIAAKSNKQLYRSQTLYRSAYILNHKECLWSHHPPHSLYLERIRDDRIPRVNRCCVNINCGTYGDNGFLFLPTKRGHLRVAS